MGYAISWVAVRGMPDAQVCETIGIRGTGEFEAFPDSELVSAQLPSGWFLVHSFLSFNDLTEFAAQLAVADAEVVAVSLDERTMTSEASGWRSGAITWAVTHSGSDDLRDLTVEGNPPKELQAIREAQFRKQDQENDHVDHVIEIPLLLAKAITGFVHDENIPGTTDDDAPFEVMTPMEGTYRAKHSGKGDCCLALLFLLALPCGIAVLFIVKWTAVAFFR